MSVVDAAVVFLSSLLIGTIAIIAGARLIVDSDAGPGNAVLTALIGALVWAVSSLALEWLPSLGWLPILGVAAMLIAWIGVVNWRYPGGWPTAAAIGFTAWIVAVAIVYALAFVGVVAPDALGVPGA